MKINLLQSWIGGLILSFCLLFPASQSFGVTEISLDDELAGPTPTPVLKQLYPVPTKKTEAVSAPAPTPVASAKKEITIEGDEEDVVDSEEAAEPTPTPYIVQGTYKVKYVYEAGIKAYKEKDYDMAIRYLNKAINSPRDAYTPKYIIAEAYAMLGVIYQYRVIHYGKAYHCYKSALWLEPGNKTAKKHIKQVYKYRNRKD
jgi:tetratricopeptide (TPR) repeat protein